MALIVQKYGGTSVGSPERIQAVADKVIQYRNQGHQLVVVVSAMSGETDRLLGLAGSICKRPVPRELDVLLATGEQATIALLSMALQEQGCPARSYTGPQVQILTDSAHNKARIQAIDAARVRQDLAEGRVVVVAGFQGVDESGSITTLGRGGSDTTAVALAAALLVAPACRRPPPAEGRPVAVPSGEPVAATPQTAMRPVPWTELPPLVDGGDWASFKANMGMPDHLVIRDLERLHFDGAPVADWEGETFDKVLARMQRYLDGDKAAARSDADLLLGGEATFWDLHVAIQDTFAWEDRHLHQFTVDHRRAGGHSRLGSMDMGT